MEPDNRPVHLMPVPGPAGTQTAAAVASSDGPPQETPGLTPPLGQGRPGMFVTDIVVELGFAPAERVTEIVKEARIAGAAPEDLMLDAGVIDADQLARATAERYGLDHVDLNVYRVDMGAANLITVESARRYQAIPVGFVDSDTLLVAVADPGNVLAVDDIQMITGLNCQVAVAAWEDIEAQIRQLNTLESAVSEAVADDDEQEGLADVR